MWTVLNLIVLFTRSQTGGQYVAAVRLVREDGTRVRRRDAVLWWFCFNPLLFSWPMAAVAGLPLMAIIFLVLSRLTIVAFGVLITLCIAAPIIALVSALLDAQNRALHDRIAGVVAVPSGLMQGDRVDTAQAAASGGAQIPDRPRFADVNAGLGTEASPGLGRSIAKWAVGFAFLLSMLALLTVAAAVPGDGRRPGEADPATRDGSIDGDRSADRPQLRRPSATGGIARAG